MGTRFRLSSLVFQSRILPSGSVHTLPHQVHLLRSPGLVVFFLRSCADPVDATRELTLGLKDAVTVLIGVSVRGKATAGVVHVPFINPRTVNDWFCFSLESNRPSFLCSILPLPLVLARVGPSSDWMGNE